MCQARVEDKAANLTVQVPALVTLYILVEESRPHRGQIDK